MPSSLLQLLHKAVRSIPLSELQELWPGPFSEPTHGAFRKARSMSRENSSLARRLRCVQAYAAMAARAGSTIEAAAESSIFSSPEKRNQMPWHRRCLIKTEKRCPGGAEIHHGLAASEGDEQAPRGEWHVLFEQPLRARVFLLSGSGRSREGERIRERSGGHGCAIGPLGMFVEPSVSCHFGVIGYDALDHAEGPGAG